MRAIGNKTSFQVIVHFLVKRDKLKLLSKIACDLWYILFQTACVIYTSLICLLFRNIQRVTVIGLISKPFYDNQNNKAYNTLWFWPFNSQCHNTLVCNSTQNMIVYTCIFNSFDHILLLACICAIYNYIIKPFQLLIEGWL